MEKSHDSEHYDTSWNLTLRFYFGKTRISRRKRNQKGKYFNQLVSGLGMMKKLGVEIFVGLSL